MLKGYENRFNNHLQPKEDQKIEFEKLVNDENSLNYLKQKYFESVVESIDLIREIFIFSSEELVNAFNFINKNEMTAFFKLISRSITDLRELNKEPQYQKGHISERLSPLERFPVIRLYGDKYLIPNFRYFDIACTELLRFALQDLYENNEYNEIMGSIQERYISELISSQLSKIEIIPEKKYKKSGSHYMGPDLTLIEGNNLIAIESKAKHITLDTRLAFHSKYLIDDLSNSFQALQKLDNEKIPDILGIENVYTTWKIKIEKTKSNIPISVIIIGEGVISMQEIINSYLRSNPEYFLNNLKYPYCIIDIVHFNNAVEIAKSIKLSLYNLLNEYWKSGKETKPKSSSAEEFCKRNYDMTESYSFKFFRELILKAKSYYK